MVIGMRSMKLLAALFWGCHRCGDATPCTDTYTDAFKSHKGKVAPKEVGDLYLKWCKKNMKVSSAKSMDELCAPLVKKVSDKMQWVPADVTVTPEIACDSVDTLKSKFPEQVAKAEATMKSSGAADAHKRETMEMAKKLKVNLESVVRETMGTWSKKLADELVTNLKAKAEDILGKDSPSPPRDALAKTMEGVASMGARGMETKLLQKLEEAAGQWASTTVKAAAAADKAKSEL